MNQKNKTKRITKISICLLTITLMQVGFFQLKNTNWMIVLKSKIQLLVAYKNTPH
jgi:hypothetical protein